MKIAGRKDVAEAVLIAALSAVAVKIADALADKWLESEEKRKKAKTK